MSRSVLAFDLEIYDEFERFEDWRKCRPLKITCVGLAYEHKGSLTGGHVWSNVEDERGVAEPMSKDAVEGALWPIIGWAKSGGVIVSYNGLAFDLPILVEAAGFGRLSPLWRMAKEVALGPRHIDLMFNMYMALGYNISLNTYAGETLGEEKLMKGHDAPRLWREGRHYQVLEYVRDDARLTRDLYLKLLENPIAHWRTRSGYGQPRRMASSVDWCPTWPVERMLGKAPPQAADWMDRPPTLKSFLEDWDD